MGMQKAIARIGVGFQSAKGTALTVPTFGHGVTGGTGFDMDIAQDRAPITSSNRVSPQVDRTDAIAKFDAQFRAHSKSIGMWLYLALGGKSVTGAGPYTHTISPSNTLPYATVFCDLGGELRAVQDVVVDSLELSWDESGIVNVAASGMGTLTAFAPSMAIATDDSNSTYMVATSGTASNLKYAASGAAAQAPIKAGSIKISNNADVISLAYSVVPDEVFWGRQDYEAALTIVPSTNLNDWRTVATGSAGGTSVSQTAVYGGLDVKFVNGSDSLQLAATRVPYTVGYPQADPSGGHVELAFAGLPVLTAAGAAALTATLINSQASYVAGT